MSDIESSSVTVAIIGGGVAGLGTAREILKLDPTASVKVFESSSQAGGLVRTYRDGDFLVEEAADCLHTFPPEGIKLCRELNLTSQILPANESDCVATIWENGRMHPLPSGMFSTGRITPGELLGTPLLSLWGKLRCCLEPFIRSPKLVEDESAQAFFERRLGPEFTARIIEPVLGAIHAAGCRQLSAQALLTQFVQQVERHGSLTRGMFATPKSGTSTGSAPGPASVSFPEGMGTFVQAIVDSLPPGTVECHRPVRRVSRTPAGTWRIEFGHDDSASVIAQQVVFACPAHVTAKLLSEAAPQLSSSLNSIPYRSALVIAAGYHRQQFGVLPESHGIFMGHRESYPWRSIAVSSAKFPGRAPGDHLLLRVTLHFSPEQRQQWDAATIDRTIDTLEACFRIQGKPVFLHRADHDASLPLYEVGHQAKVAAIEEALRPHPGLYVTGSGYRGTGVVRCLQDAQSVAKQIIEAYHRPRLARETIPC